MAELQRVDFSQLPRIAGHRGAKGSSPENTLASIRKAAGFGVSFIEFDVNLAGDDNIVVFHDYTLERCTNGNGKLVDCDYAVLSQLDAGSHFSNEFVGEKIPLLSEVMTLLDELNMGANVEIKSEPGNEQATVIHTVELLKSFWPRHLPLLVSSFSEPVMRLLNTHLSDVSRGWLVKEVPENWQTRLSEFSAESLHCRDKTLQQYQVDEVIGAGFPVLVYTVNDHMRAEQLFDWGVTSVISDHPEFMMDLDS